MKKQYVVGLAMLALVGLSACTSAPPVSEIPESISTARTPADHQRIAAFFAQKACCTTRCRSPTVARIAREIQSRWPLTAVHCATNLLLRPKRRVNWPKPIANSQSQSNSTDIHRSNQLKEQPMHDSVEFLRRQATSNLDWILDAQRAGFVWIETLTQLNATTSRKLLNQLSSSAEPLNQGKSSDFLTNAGKLVAEHCGASFESAFRTQRQLLAAASKNAPRVETANSK
jgi:hypothetical protein